MRVDGHTDRHTGTLIATLYTHSAGKVVMTRKRANAQRDSRPAEYTWRPPFNAAKFG